MFLSLIAVTFSISLAVCFILTKLFSGPVDAILKRIVADDIAYAWTRYLQFAIYVVGISGGVRIYYLERFLNQPAPDQPKPALDANRWILEIYRTVIESMQSIAWMLLVFFIFALLAYVIVRVCELRTGHKDKIDQSSSR